MYEQSAKWNALYRELEPKRRRAMLDELCLTEPDDGANAYRLRLYDARHRDERGREVDRFLFQCVSFVHLYNSAGLFRRGARKEIRSTLSDMLYDEAADYGEAGERALYWELRNAVARHLSTCEGSGYNRALFGLMSSGDVSRRERVCREVWQMSRGLALRTRLEEYMRLWNDAVIHAYLAFDDGGAALLRDYAARMGDAAIPL